MFEDLRDAFREAIANFKEELHRDDSSPTVDRLLFDMEQEVTKAKAALDDLDAQVRHTRTQIRKESEEEATCRRREEMARKVDDEETARLAAEYAARHARRREVLERKAAALSDEQALREGEVQEMMERMEEARHKRDSLAAAAGRTDADQTNRAADDLFAELDRMASTLDQSGSRTRPADELAREYEDLRIDSWAPTPRQQVDYEARLRELKRRMGRE